MREDNTNSKKMQVATLRKKETSGNVPDILECGIKRGKNYVVLTIRPVIIFRMTR